MMLGLASHATHMSGGEIYWECIGPNQFRIRLLVYRDCAGINVDPTYNLVLTSPCGNRNLTVSTPGGTEISQLCDLELPNSTCNGGTLPGIQQYIYTGTITLPPCNSWRISWTNIYRNNAIVNLTSPGTRQMYIESVLNSAGAPCNDSPTFTNSAIPFVCLGYPVSYSYGAVDSEADSLSYGLIGARMINGDPIPYVIPYTPLEPIDNLTIDPVTGLINFTLNLGGNWVVVVQVTEYDGNGNVIGTIMRDMQFVAYPCANIPPDAATGLVSNLTGSATQTGPRAVQVCESGDLCFDMEITDANASNILEAVSNIQQNLPGSTFSFTGTNPITASVCWTAQPGTAGFYPFIVNVNDGACPIPAFQTYVYSVEVLPGLAATIQVVDESCAGIANGSAEAIVSAGTGPYSYTWSTGSSESMIMGGAGNYTVDITDANGCTRTGIPAVIGTAGQPNQADAGSDIISCNITGPVALQGSVVNATGGVWSDGAGTFNGVWPVVSYTPTPGEVLAGGVDVVLTTTGNSGCPEATDTVHVDLPNSFTASSITSLDASCNGTPSGSATAIPQDPTFTYAWDDPAAQSTATATMLGAGNYSVLITDSYGCDTTLTTTVGQPAALILSSVTPTNEACLGTGDGSATATATGGTAPYSYQWSNGDTGSSITETSGTYIVTVTDANGCLPVTGSTIIGAFGLPNQANAGPDVVICPGQFPIYLNESVVNATGGIWSGGSGTMNGSWPNYEYTPSATDIANGYVTLTLTTVGNTTCPPASDTMLLTLPDNFASVAITPTDATCYGLSTGSATVTSGNGFTYMWDPSAQTTATATGLAAGDHTVVVTDSYGCFVTLNTTIGQPNIIALGNVTATNETCAGDANGSLTVNPSGGTAPYSYTWSNGGNTASISAAAGNYSVSVTDANGCAVANGSGTIVATGQPNTASAGPDLVGCMNAYPIAVQGAVQNAVGGQWSGGSGIFMGNGLSVQYMPTSSEIINGGVDLTLTTTGNNSCPPASDVVHITLSNGFLQAALTTTNASCNGTATGTIVFTPQNSDFSYLWNDLQAQTTASATNLAAGSYTVVVTDGLGCDTMMSATVTEPATLAAAQVAHTDVSCAGGSNGTVSLTITGGTPAYNVSWLTGQSSANISGLPAGNYIVNISDAQGCTTQASALVAQPQPLAVTVQAPDTVCVNTPAQLIAAATGGAGGYIFNWGGFGFNDTVQLAFSSTQTVLLTVVDQAGCSGPNTPVTIAVLDLNSADLITYGDTTVCVGGTATVGASLVNYPGLFSINWSAMGYTGMGPYVVPISADQNIQVTVSDACGNSLQNTIGLRLDIAPSFALPPIIAEGCAPLRVQFPLLDLGNVVYTWDLGNGTTSHVPAPEVIYTQGSYTASLSVTTSLGCTSNSSNGGQIIAYGSPTAAFSPSTTIANIDAPTIVFTNQSTGNSINSYSWTFGDGGTSSVMDPAYNFNEIGTFDVELYIVDIHGCTGVVSRPITIEPVYDVVIPTAFTPDPNGGGGSGSGGGNWVTGDLSNDVFYPFVRFVEDFRMRIFNRWGELIFESTDLSIGWDGFYRGECSPQDVYVVQSWFKFVDGKKVEKLTDLTLFR